MSPYHRRTPAPAQDELDALSVALERYRLRAAELSRELAEQVHSCLHAGATWGEVGARIGMTKQGAREHWGPYIQGMMAERSASRPAPRALRLGSRAQREDGEGADLQQSPDGQE